MDFAANLKRVCVSRGTSPTALCQQLNLSTSKVSLWNGGSLPKAEVIVRMAQALHCQPYEFFMDDPSALTQPQPSADISDDEQEILSIYRNLSRREKHEFMAELYHRFSPDPEKS